MNCKYFEQILSQTLYKNCLHKCHDWDDSAKHQIIRRAVGGEWKQYVGKSPFEKMVPPPRLLLHLLCCSSLAFAISSSSPLSVNQTWDPSLIRRMSVQVASMRKVLQRKHRKNCECCPLSLFIFIKNCHKFKFSTVRIVMSVSNVTSLYDCSLKMGGGGKKFDMLVGTSGT